MQKIVSENKPANHRKAVVFCVDKNVVRFAQFVADQIMKSEPVRDYDICICTFDANILALDKVDPEIRICQVDEAPFAELAADSRVTSTAYILLGLPEIFADEYDQIAYLDADIYLNGGKISELFAAASPDYSISGVLDVCQWNNLSAARWETYFKATGIVGKKYLNTGVLVLNTSMCREEKFTKKTMAMATHRAEFVEKYPNVYFFHDQTAINSVLKGRWAELSLGWNWQITYFASRLIKEFEPKIIHFISSSKPWARNPVDFTRQFRPDYVAFFRDHLNEDLRDNNFGGRPKKTPRSLMETVLMKLKPTIIVRFLNQANPLFYTKIRELGAVMRGRATIKMLENTINDRRATDNDANPVEFSDRPSK